VDTGAYGSKAYDAVPQDQGKKIKMYGLGQQVPTKAQSKEGKKHKVALTLTWVKHLKHKTAMAQLLTLMLKLMMLVTLTNTTKVGVTKALHTKKGGVDAKIVIENETLHWHKVTSKKKKHVLDAVPQEMTQETSACVYKRTSERPFVNVRPCVVKYKREGSAKAHKVIGDKESKAIMLPMET
jgi:hypothetical protein